MQTNRRKDNLNMKKTILFVLLIAFTALGIVSCGSDVVAPADTLINFTMGTAQGTQGTVFTWNPSKDVKLSKLIVVLPGVGTDTITDNGQTTYTAGQNWSYQNEYTVQSGETWLFYFTGVLASGNTPFTNAADTLRIP